MCWSGVAPPAAPSPAPAAEPELLAHQPVRSADDAIDLATVGHQAASLTASSAGRCAVVAPAAVLPTATLPTAVRAIAGSSERKCAPTLSVRASAERDGGYSIRQEIIRAYGLR